MHHAAVQYASHDASAFIGYLQYDTLKFIVTIYSLVRHSEMNPPPIKTTTEHKSTEQAANY